MIGSLPFLKIPKYYPFFPYFKTFFLWARKVDIFKLPSFD
nr:MAG TPA: hypothetical protein [Caudoviricetes sp.]